MSATYLGSFSLGAAIPLAASAEGAISASVAAALPEIQAQLTGALEAQARITATPPSLAGSLSAAQEIVASLQVAISLGLPGASFQLTALATLIADLQTKVADLQAQAAIGASLAAALGSAGAHLYTVDSTAGQAGADLDSVIGSGPPGSSPGDPVFGVVLLATIPGTQGSLKLIFKTS